VSDSPQPVDFDARPPMPVSEYEQTVRRINVGYDLIFTLTHSFLRALRKPNLELLVVGAGGGAEIERFLPENPDWRLTGVDPSRDMLAVAQAKVERLGLGDRVTLIQGTVETLPTEARFDAATCLFVLHFLPDEEKLALLRGIAARLRPDEPLLVAAGVRPEDTGLGEDFIGAWQQYGELVGMPAERMAAMIQQLSSQMTRPGTTSAEGYVSVLREAGFPRVACFFSALGGIGGWIAR
jgi:tRNA (cmo5U34)-methyltransferase